jgi:hypothetical protein
VNLSLQNWQGQNVSASSTTRARLSLPKEPCQTPGGKTVRLPVTVLVKPRHSEQNMKLSWIRRWPLSGKMSHESSLMHSRCCFIMTLMTKAPLFLRHLSFATVIDAKASFYIRQSSASKTANSWYHVTRYSTFHILTIKSYRSNLTDQILSIKPYRSNLPLFRLCCCILSEAIKSKAERYTRTRFR